MSQASQHSRLTGRSGKEALCPSFHGGGCQETLSRRPVRCCVRRRPPRSAVLRVERRCLVSVPGVGVLPQDRSAILLLIRRRVPGLVRQLRRLSGRSVLRAQAGTILPSGPRRAIELQSKVRCSLFVRRHPIHRLVRSDVVVIVDPGVDLSLQFLEGGPVARPHELDFQSLNEAARQPRFPFGRPTGAKVCSTPQSSHRSSQSPPVYCGPWSVRSSRPAGTVIGTTELFDERLAQPERAPVRIPGSWSHGKPRATRSPQSITGMTATTPSSRVHTVVRSVAQRRLDSGTVTWP